MASQMFVTQRIIDASFSLSSVLSLKSSYLVILFASTIAQYHSIYHSAKSLHLI